MVDEVDFAVGHVDAGGMIPLVASARYITNISARSHKYKQRTRGTEKSEDQNG